MSFVPQIVRTGYGYIKMFLNNMTDHEAQRAKVESNGGGVMGALKSSCNIF